MLIRKRRDQLHCALVHQGLIRRLITGFLTVLISVGAVSLFFKDSELSNGLFLGIATIVVCLWLSRPLPLVMQDRLAEAVEELDQAGQRLLSIIEESSILTDPVRRQVEDLLQKLGEHVVDLCMDGQRAVRARRRWLP